MPGSQSQRLKTFLLNKNSRGRQYSALKVLLDDEKEKNKNNKKNVVIYMRTAVLIVPNHCTCCLGLMEPNNIWRASVTK